jgi:hypothetical protein
METFTYLGREHEAELGVYIKYLTRLTKRKIYEKS